MHRRTVNPWEKAIINMQENVEIFNIQGSLIEANSRIQNGIRILDEFSNPNDDLINSLSNEAKAISEICSNGNYNHGSEITLIKLENLIDEEQIQLLIGEEYILPKFNSIESLKFDILESGGILGFVQHNSQDDLRRYLNHINDEFSISDLQNNSGNYELYEILQQLIKLKIEITRFSKFQHSLLNPNR